MPVTVILGVPERPVAFPVKLPLNVVAVTTPMFCIFLLSSITVVPEILMAFYRPRITLGSFYYL